MELVKRSNSDIIKKGTAILETKPFIHDFLEIFSTEKSQDFLKNNVRTDMEWKSVGVYVKLHAYIVKMLGYNPGKETMAFYLHSIMTHAKLRRSALNTLQEKPRAIQKKKLMSIENGIVKK